MIDPFKHGGFDPRATARSRIAPTVLPPDPFRRRSTDRDMKTVYFPGIGRIEAHESIACNLVAAGLAEYVTPGSRAEVELQAEESEWAAIERAHNELGAVQGLDA
jgi:hypothetical protein